jgi:hypothetical protein
MSDLRQLGGIDLRADTAAHWVVKDEVVAVAFAPAAAFCRARWERIDMSPVTHC